MPEGTSGSGAQLAARFAEARAAAARGLDDGLDGIALAEALTAHVERLVLDHVNGCLSRAGFGRDSGLAILATGGFGRREFAPCSDLDLVFLCAEPPDSRIEKLAQAILFPLFDARLDAGHSVRSVDEALALPENDLTAATALLDARFLAGDGGVAGTFAARYAALVSSARPDGLVARLREEQRTRHSKFGDTVFLLEPDIKNGPGGIRDMCVGRWAAHARFGTGDPKELARRGQMTARQAEAFEAAREWFLRVRIAVHLEAGRKQDQMRFDLQEAIAPVICRDIKPADGEIRPSVAPAVEALMRDYQRHARTIIRETERLLQRASADPTWQARREPVFLKSGNGAADPVFELLDGSLEVIDPATFERRPNEMFRLFAAAVELDAPIGLRTSDVVGELAVVRAAAIREDSEAARWFLQVLCDPEDRATPSRLDQMQDLGLLAALMPEWEPCTGRVQYDVYHVYTVDQHSLYAVDLLKQVARAELVDQHPQAVQEMQLLHNPVPLYLSMLLHDVGKPLGKNHSLKGATVAAAIAWRLGLGEDDVRKVELLVREHLTMGLTSQRRNLDESGVVERFARLVGDEETLRQLYLITFCDLTCVGPGNLTAWKDELLREFLRRTQVFFRHGPDLLRAEQTELMRERRRQATERLLDEVPGPELEVVFDSMPERYFIENAVTRIAAHVRLLRSRSGPCAVSFTHHPKRGYSEMVLSAEDHPGLLAKVAGVLFANRIDILDAAIYSRAASAASPNGEALDIFRVRKAYQGAVTDQARIASIERDLRAVLSGSMTVEALVASRPQGKSLLERRKPKVPATEVRTDNDASAEFTVIDVFTEDRPGVLYSIAHVLHDSGLDIHRSKVGVEADRVADVFYVRDRGTKGKVTDPARLGEIARQLREALPRRDDERVVKPSDKATVETLAQPRAGYENVS